MTGCSRVQRLGVVAVLSMLCGACASVPAEEVAPRPRLGIEQPPMRKPGLGLQSGVLPDANTRPATEYFGGAKPTSAKPAVSVSTDGRRYELNLQDAEVRSVVDAILGDLFKANYSVSPQVQGRITLRTGRPVTKEAMLSVLETALVSASAALLEQDGAYHVVPLDQAPQRIRSARRLDETKRSVPGYGIEVVPLRFMSAREMSKILDSFAPKGSVLQADETHNHIVLSGTGQERSAMIRTIDAFDVDGMSGTLFAMYHVSNLMPEQLVAELRQVFQPPLDLLGSRVRLVPMDRMKVVLGIAKNKADLDTVDEWVKKLDVAPKTGGKRLYVYNVQNGSAKELAASLQLVLTGEGRTERGRSRTPASEGATGNGTADQAPVPTATPSLPSEGGQAGASRVVSNDENNSIIFYGTDAEYAIIKDALAKLDVLPRQVLIEAILAEVTLNDSLRYGVQWFFNSSANSFAFSSVDSGAVASQYPGFSYVYSGLSDARVVINALQSKTDVKVLSAPKLAVLNNQKASLQVGDEVPIRTQTSQSTVGVGSPVISTIQMRETGVMLDVTPRVNDNGNVILEVTQEVSDVAATVSSGIDSPTIQRRRLRSVIATRDGATVALGGLIRDTSSKGNSGVPWLKDLPVVGNLFKTNTVETRRTELMVLLVPRVMRNHEETEAVMDQLIDGFQAASQVVGKAVKIVPKPNPQTP